MATVAAPRREGDLSGSLDDMLDRLAAAYSGMVERFGQIVGENVPQPEDPIPFAAKMARSAAVIDTASDAGSKRLALLRHEGTRHEQIGRLAMYVADYEAAHGDPGKVPAMRDLGSDHLDLAAGLRETASDEDARQRGTRGDNTRHEGNAMTDEREHHLKAIDRDPWHAVEMSLPDGADVALLHRIAVTAAALALEKNQEMFGILNGELPDPEWAGQEDAPDAHEEAEAFWLKAEARMEAADAALVAMGEPASGSNFLRSKALQAANANPFDAFVSDETRADKAAENAKTTGKDLNNEL